MQKQKGFSVLIVLLIIVAIEIITLGGVFAYKYFITKSQQNSQFLVSRPKTDQTQNQTTGWKTYTNNDYGFSFQYPTNFGDWSFFKTGLALDQGTYGNILINYPHVFGNLPDYPETFFDLKTRFSGIGYVESNTTIGDIPSIKVSSPQIGDIVYVPFPENKILEIDGNFKNPVFNQLLSTFKFTK